jgi:hypothetical protein
MKKILSFILLISTVASTVPAQVNQINSTISQNAIDWNDHDALEKLFEKFIEHYEKNHPKALFHALYEEGYKEKPDYLGITILSSLEKFAFDYVNQNPNAINLYLNEIEKMSPKNAELTIEDILISQFFELREQADALGLNITDDQIKVLAVFQLSMIRGFAPDTQTTFNLFQEIVEYAKQEIQN